MAYRDIVRLETRVVEAAFREGSVELNVDESCWEGFRVYNDYAWRIRSWRCGAAKTPEPSGGGNLKDAILYTGFYESGVGELEPEEVERIAVEAGEAAGNCTTEVIVENVCIRRSIVHYEGEAVHKHCLLEANISVTGGGVSISDRVALAPQEARLLPRLVENMCEKLRAAQRSFQRLSPLDTGRWSIILAGTAAGALVHEVSHALEGDWGPRLPRNLVIAPEEFNMLDEPGYKGAPYHHVFDDEGVVAIARRLITLGRVNDYLGVRWRGVGAPGSARGLFHPPKAMHTVLRVEPGDWRDSEIVEETRRGILVETVYEALLDTDGVIEVKPELAWLVDHGEVRGFIRVSRIRLRIARDMKSIDALGRRLWPRLSTEKGYYQLELAPTIRLQAYVD